MLNRVREEAAPAPAAARSPRFVAVKLALMSGFAQSHSDFALYTAARRMDLVGFTVGV